MGSSLLITLREGLEIALVLAIIVAYLNKTGRSDRLGSVWAGSTLAAVLCVATGVLFHQMVGEFEGKWEQFIEGTLAFAAAGVLTWMIFWMRSHARGIGSELHAKIDAAIDQSTYALAIVAFIAVAREGFETVLFLLGAESSGSSGSAVVVGGIAGLGIAAVLGYLFYLGSDRVDLRSFFKWTGLLLILFAAGLFAKGVHEFREYFEFESGWYSNTAWNITSGPLASGWVHDFMKGLFGWSPDPERIRVVAYIAFLIPTLWFYFRGASTTPATSASPPVAVRSSPGRDEADVGSPQPSATAR